MNNIIINNVEVEFKVVDNKVFANSLQVAEVFEKRHTHILDTIKALPQDDFTKPNFRLSEYKDATGRTLPMYNLTRDGFFLLVMGFTGEKAYKWKVEFLKAFNKIDTMLKSKELTNTPHLDNLIKSVSKLNLKLSELDSKNKALASDLIIAKDKYTSLLEKQVSLLESRSEVSTLSQNLAKKGTRLSLDEISQINKLYKDGHSKAKICRILGRSDTAINNAIKKANLF
ncbi:helix-turn-helix domain-containing protein [Campylobacter sp. FMV-PI01]|uniref:Helix-turn-helix domain-containing protein n=1 Tax=Campylobacter portucalensis TaxID=2608384 RepID=A0A6L5WJ03_9BACT|nr:Rha family transcriptional regulator [Campylobacter portucalensis]MSN96442.1 helix-turn-helix domain-containing protein [Campylobacter portucalensis]